jgi:hypothetical protein
MTALRALLDIAIRSPLRLVEYRQQVRKLPRRQAPEFVWTQAEVDDSDCPESPPELFTSSAAV